MISLFFAPPISLSVLLLLITGVASLRLDAVQLLTLQSAGSQNTSKLSANVSLADDGRLASSSNLSHLILQCDPSQNGFDLNYDSCHDAYDQIPHLVSEMTWGPRTQGRWAINLPWRVYSCKCDACKRISYLSRSRRKRTIGADAAGTGHVHSRRIMRHQRELAIRHRGLGYRVVVPRRPSCV